MSQSVGWSCRRQPPAAAGSRDLRGLRTFHGDYPESSPLLLYRGDETLERGGVRCVPVDRFLRELIPGRDLPC